MGGGGLWAERGAGRICAPKQALKTRIRMRVDAYRAASRATSAVDASRTARVARPGRAGETGTELLIQIQTLSKTIFAKIQALSNTMFEGPVAPYFRPTLAPDTRPLPINFGNAPTNLTPNAPQRLTERAPSASSGTCPVARSGRRRTW